MTDSIINIKNGVKSIVKLSENLYAVTDGEGNVLTLTESQLRTLPNATQTLTEGTQLICG